jgi:hypothetical protein
MKATSAMLCVIFFHLVRGASSNSIVYGLALLIVTVLVQFNEYFKPKVEKFVFAYFILNLLPFGLYVVNPFIKFHQIGFGAIVHSILNSTNHTLFDNFIGS